MVTLCIHVANVLYLLSYLCWDILWLRLLTCAGLALGIVFFGCHEPTPLYGPLLWQIAFLGINGVQIWRLVLDRQQLMLTPEQERVGEATFGNLSREELITLLTRAMCRQQIVGPDVAPICQKPLTAEERALRDIAFSRLSRQELVNLLTRRMWNSLRRGNPLTWRRRRRAIRSTQSTALPASVSQPPSPG